jgi:endonuclease G
MAQNKKKTTRPKSKSKAKSSKKKGKATASKSGNGKKISLSLVTIVVVAVSMYLFIPHESDDIIDLATQQEQDGSDVTDITTSVSSVASQDILDQYPLSQYYPVGANTNNELVEHTAYSLSYNEAHEQADWVIYDLTKSEVETKKFERKDNFKKDPSSNITSANTSDYSRSGYDRGHLCPAADNRWSEVAMNESFYMSNISPQSPNLNRRIWKTLEEQVREWALENEKLYIVTGPILKDGFLKKIGKNQVSVPKYYYKVIADLTGKDRKGIAFIFSNGENNGELKYYPCSIDNVEKRTGFDFFYNLDNKIEQEIESDFNSEEWF